MGIRLIPLNQVGSCLLLALVWGCPYFSTQWECSQYGSDRKRVRTHPAFSLNLAFKLCSFENDIQQHSHTHSNILSFWKKTFKSPSKVHYPKNGNALSNLKQTHFPMWSVQINNASIYELKPVTLIMLSNEYWLMIMIIKVMMINLLVIMFNFMCSFTALAKQCITE